MKTALITGASHGLGRALSIALAEDGWALIVDGRRSSGLDELVSLLRAGSTVTVIPGDVADAAHRHALHAAVARAGALHLLVNNASTLGPVPLAPLGNSDLNALAGVFGTNTIAPLQLSVALLPHLAHTNGVVVNISSDAGAEHYEGWGLYGASKAALDHLTLTMAAENPGIHWYAVDPGDMRTAMQQQAFPGEDISDRQEPSEVVPAFLALIAAMPPSGRYRAADLPALLGVGR